MGMLDSLRKGAGMLQDAGPGIGYLQARRMGVNPLEAMMQMQQMQSEAERSRYYADARKAEEEKIRLEQEAEKRRADMAASQAAAAGAVDQMTPEQKAAFANSAAQRAWWSGPDADKGISEGVFGSISGPTDETLGVSPVEVVGPNGKRKLLQLGNRGTTKEVTLPEGYEVAERTEKIDTGNGTLLVDRATQQPITFIPRELAPNETPSYKREAATQTAIGTGEGEATVTAPKEAARAGTQIAKAEGVMQEINKALGNVSGWNTGFVGATLAKVPQTSAYDLASTLRTVKANIGFDTLAEMRQNSPTGGALGQVAVQELESLQASLASLDQGQSKAQLEANLQKVLEHYNNWKKIYLSAQAQAQQRSGIVPNSSPAQGAPTELELLRAKHGIR